jgi:hypothetical protein
MNTGSRPFPPHRVPTLTEVVEAPQLPAHAPVPAAPVQGIDAGLDAEPGAAVGQAGVTADAGADLAANASAAQAPVDEVAVPAAERRPEPHAIDEAALTERILGDLQRQVELMLEYRLREVLAPALARATDTLVAEARVELASTLRLMVGRAVAQELLRHRGR